MFLVSKIIPVIFKSISDRNRHCLITEYIDLHGPSKPSQLGRDLARLSFLFYFIFALVSFYRLSSNFPKDTMYKLA